MPDLPKHSVSVAGVVFGEDDRILVIKRADNGAWEIPGGVLELGETFQEGVAREVLEETGLQVQVGELTGVYKNLTHAVVALVFRCTPTGGQARRTVEASETAWMSIAEVESAMNKAFAIRVLDACEGRVHARAHDGTNLLQRRAAI